MSLKLQLIPNHYRLTVTCANITNLQDDVRTKTRFAEFHALPSTPCPLPHARAYSSSFSREQPHSLETRRTKIKRSKLSKPLGRKAHQCTNPTTCEYINDKPTLILCPCPPASPNAAPLPPDAAETAAAVRRSRYSRVLISLMPHSPANLFTPQRIAKC